MPRLPVKAGVPILGRMWKCRIGLRARVILLRHLRHLRHLRNLAEAAREFARGRFDVADRIADAPAELGRVVRAFGRMARALERRQGALEVANQRLHALSTRLLETQEAERRSVARELHEEVCQALAAIKMNVQAVHDRTPSPQTEASLAGADAIIRRVRAFSATLRPPQLDELGLTAAVRAFLERRALESGLRIALHVDIAAARLPKALEVACFRVIQEGLENVIGHAAAVNAWVSLTCCEQELQAEIADDGCGFDVQASGPGAGLSAAMERVRIAGGRLEIVSSADLGTEIRVTLPLSAACSAPRARSVGEGLLVTL
jgi:two-component system sensor histidine kinase UhpB